MIIFKVAILFYGVLRSNLCLKDNGITVYRTDEDGTIICTSDIRNPFSKLK